jgi:hypothetical protein
MRNKGPGAGLTACQVVTADRTLRRRGPRRYSRCCRGVPVAAAKPMYPVFHRQFASGPFPLAPVPLAP